MRVWFCIVAAALVGCTDRSIVDDEPSEDLRAAVEAHCREFCPLAEECHPFFDEVSPGGVRDCIDRCVKEPGWYVAGACGDVYWDYGKCIAASSCEEVESRARGEYAYDHDAPCYMEQRERIYGECRYEFFENDK